LRCSSRPPRAPGDVSRGRTTCNTPLTLPYHSSPRRVVVERHDVAADGQPQSVPRAWWVKHGSKTSSMFPERCPFARIWITVRGRETTLFLASSSVRNRTARTRTTAAMFRGPPRTARMASASQLGGQLVRTCLDWPRVTSEDRQTAPWEDQSAAGLAAEPVGVLVPAGRRRVEYISTRQRTVRGLGPGRGRKRRM